MSVNLKDYPSIDIMNHLLEIRRDLAGNPFEFQEFQIMLKTTFKKLTQKPDPAKEANEAEGRPKKKSAGAMLSGHGSAAECVEHMDELGYAHVAICATKMWSYHYHHDFIMDYPMDPIGEAVEETGGRIVGAASYSPFHIGQSVADVERGVKEMGFKYVWFYSLSFGLPPNDRRFYPLYQKCGELDIAVSFQVSHSAEVLPSDCGRPMLADEVAIDFPDLRINLSHTGWPWVDEALAMAGKHANVFLGTAAFPPHHWSPELLRFIAGPGSGKVMLGTSFPVVGHRHALARLADLELSPDARDQLLNGTARRVFRRLTRDQ